MKTAVRRLVRRRAGNRCEYCLMHEDDDPYLDFHIEHIFAKQHHGSDRADNLAWSCHKCNRAKGPNLAGRIGTAVIALFHPRRQKWSRHFRWIGPRIVGRTRCGKVTIQVLDLNAPERLVVRTSLIAAGVFPPP